MACFQNTLNDIIKGFRHTCTTFINKKHIVTTVWYSSIHDTVFICIVTRDNRVDNYYRGQKSGH